MGIIFFVSIGQIILEKGLIKVIKYYNAFNI